MAAAVAVIAAGRAVRRARLGEQRAHDSADHARRLKNEFVSMVSHELRTPLTSIAGFAETLQGNWRDIPPEEVDEFIRIIGTQAHHLGELVEDILVIPRLEAGRLQIDRDMHDLADAVYEVTDAVLPKGSGVEALVSVPSGLQVYADRSRFLQILRNLVENARKYGGDQVMIEGVDLGPHVLVVVADNGPGVAAPDRERIFEHFEQITKGDSRREDGIGLGLPIARRLAKAMGGDLWFEERFPTGSRFCFTVYGHPPVLDENGLEVFGVPPADPDDAGVADLAAG